MTKQRYFQIAGLIIGVVFVFIGVLYLFTHGVISLQSASGNQESSYVSLDSTNTPVVSSFRGKSAVAPSGEYTLVTSNSSDMVSFYTINVPRFLTSTNVSLSTNEPLTSAIGRKTGINIGIKNSKPISWEDNGSITPLDSTNISGDRTSRGSLPNFPSFSQSVQISPILIGGLVRTNQGYQPAMYNLDSETTNFAPLIITSKPVYIERSAGGFSAFDTGNKIITSYTSKDASVQSSLSVKSNTDLATYNNTPLYSYSPTKLALATGRVMNDGGDGEVENDASKPLNLLIVDVKTKKQVVKISLADMSIRDVVLSPDGNHVFVEGNQSAGIYNTTTGKREFTIPYAATQFIWSDSSDQFVFQAEADIFLGSVKNKNAISLVPNNTLRPTNISFIDEGYVYFTAYTTKTDGNKLPDAYRSALKSSTNSSSRSILKHLPYQGSGFYIDSLDNTITIQTTRYITDNGTLPNSSALDEAKKYIQNNIPDTSKYTVEERFIDMDLRTPSQPDDPQED